MLRPDQHADHHAEGDQTELEDGDDLPVAGFNVSVCSFKQFFYMLSSLPIDYPFFMKEDLTDADAVALAVKGPWPTPGILQKHRSISGQ